MFSFNRSYILLIIFLLLAQAGLDFFISHTAVYPILSNIIVALMLYAILKTFWRAKPIVAGVVALLLATAIEIMPHLHFADPIVLWNNLIMISTGNSFLTTVLPYATGILLALMTERAIRQAATPATPNKLR
ncbi:hypothetical protein D770_09040 [Flammeovirgaceae bacterium 311]|nr:hypothetical protein D770_09040 [Flammeovirgaceae bacterium 311]